MDKLLSNPFFTAKINSFGAELVSFKKLADNCEYIWNGDKTFWTGHSPLLFPIVGSLQNNEMKVDGNVYSMGNHGFARRSEFQFVEGTDSKAVYKLGWSEASLAMYPFKFSLYVTYTLIDNKLHIDYRVENNDDKTMYFQIGAHPAFQCPLDSQTNFEDYSIEFESPEKLEKLYSNSARLIIAGKSEPVELQNGKILPLHHEVFHEGTLVIKNIHSKKVTLQNRKTDKKVVVTYDDLPYVGIWQAKNAPFICIEPWHGIGDSDEFSGELKDKELIIPLKKAAVYHCSIMIEIH